MRLFIILVLLVSVAAIPQIALADQATTIDELIAPYDSSRCAECHEDIHDNWAKSWHAKTITDSRVLRTWRTFILSGLDKSQGKRRDLKDICLPCHAPATRDASDELVVKIADMIVTAVEDKDQSKKDAALKQLSKLNINCIICHNMKGSPDGKPQPNTIYGPGEAEEPPHMEEFGFNTVKSEFLKTPEFCAECHHGCPPDMPSSVCPTLYTSYKEQYLAHGGDKTCQQCHMQKDGEGSSHRFPGIHEVDFAKTGIDLKLSASPTQYVYHLEDRFVPAVVLNVQLTNTSGHGIPHG